MQLGNILKNITPAIAVMIVGVGGAYLTYDKFFSNKVSAVEASTFEPAAGEEAQAPVVDETAAPAPAEGLPAAEIAPTVQCKMDNGVPVMKEDGSSCVPAEVQCMMDEKGAPVMKEDGSGCMPMPTAETAPAVESPMAAPTEAPMEAPAVETPVAPEAAPPAAH